MNTVRFALSGCCLVFLATGLGASACASQASSVPGTTGGGTDAANYNVGGTTGTGSSQASGSTTGTGNTPGTGGTTSSSGYTFVGTVTAAPGTTPIPVPTSFVSCASPVPTDGGIQTCQYANCVPANTADSLMTSSQKTLLGMCSDGTSYCVPDDFIATLGKFELATCKSIDNAEGRCISTCIPEVAKMINELPKDVCADTERCAPCYFPWPVASTDGGSNAEQTGACTAGVGDSPKQPPVLFPTCGVTNGGAPQGLCVPSSLVPADLLSAVPPDTCTSGQLCAPTQKVMDLSYKFPACTGGLGAGACVPDYLALYAGGDPTSQLAAAAFATCSSLGVTGLPAGNDWVCAPCTNPLTGKPTGACL